jgi:hypothetical protein
MLDSFNWGCSPYLVIEAFLSLGPFPEALDPSDVYEGTRSSLKFDGRRFAVSVSVLSMERLHRLPHSPGMRRGVCDFLMGVQVHLKQIQVG